MMSLPKVVTAVGILKMMEQGKIGLDDELSKYIPEFSDMRVSCDERYRIDLGDYKKLFAQLPLFQMEEVKSVPAEEKSRSVICFLILPGSNRAVWGYVPC